MKVAFRGFEKTSSKTIGKLVIYLKGTLIVLIFIKHVKSHNKGLSPIMSAIILMSLTAVSHFLIPTYERAMSKVAESLTVESLVDTRYPFVGVMLPVLVVKGFFWYQISQGNHLGPMRRPLHFLNEFFFVAYQFLKLVKVDQSDFEWDLYLPRMCYVLSILLWILSACESDMVSCSAHYNVQVLVGNAICPISYLLTLVESSVLQPQSELLNSLYGYLQSAGMQYMTGHIPRFTHLQLFSGFVGFRKFHYVTAPLLVYLNTAGPMIFSLNLFGSVAPQHKDTASANKEPKVSTKTKTLATIAVLWVVQLGAMNAFVAIERENLHFADYMAPKYIFDVVLAVTVLGLGLVKLIC